MSRATNDGSRICQHWQRSANCTGHFHFRCEYNYSNLSIYHYLCDKVYQLLAHGRWFSPGTPTSSTTKTGRHDLAEILLKVALNTKNQSNLILIYLFIIIYLSNMYYLYLCIECKMHVSRVESLWSHTCNFRFSTSLSLSPNYRLHRSICSSGHQGHYKHVTATVHFHLWGYWKIPFNCQIIVNLLLC
jgi:hypothetical protein